MTRGARLRTEPKEWWRARGRVSLNEAEQGFRYFRLVPPQASEYAREGPSQAGEPVMIEQPSLPPTDHVVRGEDRSTLRVSMGPSILHCLGGLAGHMRPDDLLSDPANMEDAGGRCHGWFIYGVRDAPEGLLGNDQVAQLVPDATHTGEVWGTMPVRMEHIGTLGGDFGPDDTYGVWACP